LDRHREDAVTALPSKCSNGQCIDTGEKRQKTLGKEICRQTCRQEGSSTNGRRWRRQLKTQYEGEMWSLRCGL